MEEIKKREGFQLLLEVSESRTELSLLLEEWSVCCLILFFSGNYQFVFEVYDSVILCVGANTDMTKYT